MKWIPAPSQPAGWLGKPNASHTGAHAARGQWLLFTDADMEHKALSAASAVGFAQAHNLDGLSIFPQQETRGLLDSAVLMVAFTGLFAGLRRSTTMLNGQYILVRREVYDASGGFAAVRAEMMEDLAYGRLLAEQGYQVPIMRGESLATVHMYDNRRQMWHGVNRLGSGSLRYNGILALIPMIFVTGLMMPLWTLLFNRRYVREIPNLWLIWFASLAGYLPWVSRFNGSQKTKNKKRSMVLGAVMAPLAAVFVQLAAVWGMISRLLGWGVSWKDRKV
jgi:chlorobactene glucosyltransferase